MKYRVTVTRSDVYAVDASTLIGAEQVALRAAREGLPPDYSMNAEASAVPVPIDCFQMAPWVVSATARSRCPGWWCRRPRVPGGDPSLPVGEATTIRKAERDAF